MNSVPLIKVPLAFVVITSNIYVFIFFYESTICVYILHQFKKTFFISVCLYMLHGIACKFMN